MLFGDTKKKILTMEKLRKMDSNKRSSPFSLGFSSSKRLEIETQEKVINKFILKMNLIQKFDCFLSSSF
jgi:hypothetical protein